MKKFVESRYGEIMGYSKFSNKVGEIEDRETINIPKDNIEENRIFF